MECDKRRGYLKNVKLISKMKLGYEDLGIPVAAAMQADPSTCIEFLHIIIDMVKQELQLLSKKIKTDRLHAAV